MEVHTRNYDKIIQQNNNQTFHFGTTNVLPQSKQILQAQCTEYVHIQRFH